MYDLSWPVMKSTMHDPPVLGASVNPWTPGKSINDLFLWLGQGLRYYAGSLVSEDWI